MMEIKEFVKHFHLVMDRSRSTMHYAYLRSTITSKEEANEFVEHFAEKTNTNWAAQKKYSLKYIFYCTWFCKPFWKKTLLPEGDNFNPFYRKSDSSQGDECCAKIDIYIRKPDTFATYDEYLYYDPPLPCVIEIAGQHNHPLKCLGQNAMMEGINDKLRSLVPESLLPDDMENYWQWKLTNSVKQFRLKPNVVPHIFDCQKRGAAVFKRRAFKNKDAKEITKSSCYNAEVPSTSNSVSKISRTSSGNSVISLDCNDFQVKREFFKYFQMGLSVSAAKKKFTIYCKEKKKSKQHPTIIPTLRQTEILYKEWQTVKDEEEWKLVKDSSDSAFKEGIFRKSEEGTITFKEFLDIVPKKEIMHSVKHLESETDTPVVLDKNAQNQDVQFPLVFVSSGSVACMPDGTVPLLYKLKHGISSELVSDLVSPRIYSLCIESEPVSDEILGISTSSDNSCVSVEANPKYSLDIPIKLEPLNDGYEDTPNQGSNEMKDTCILPKPVQSFSCGDSREVDVEPNICGGDTTTTEEIDIKPNICIAGRSFFPLMFTLKGSVYETSNSRSLVYDLKQGSAGVQATDAVISQIASVQINSLKEATFHLNNAAILTSEGPLNITIQTETLEEILNSVSSNDGVNGKVDDGDIPVIIEASSDHLPVITDYESLREQMKISDPETEYKSGAYKRLKTDIKQERSFNAGFFSLY